MSKEGHELLRLDSPENEPEPGKKRQKGFVSVLDQLKGSARLQKEEKVVARMHNESGRQFYLQAGVPMTILERERLRFSSWTESTGDALASPTDLVAYSPSGEYLGSIQRDGNIVIQSLDLQMSSDLRFNVRLSIMKWSGPTEIVACSRSNGRALLVNMVEPTGAMSSSWKHAEFDCNEMTSLQDVAMGRDDQILFAGGRNGKLFGWDRRMVKELALKCDPGGKRGSLSCLETSRDGQILISASQRGVVDLWDVRKMAKKPIWSGDTPKLCFGRTPSGDWMRDGILAMKLDPESDSLLVVQGAHGQCGAIDLVTLKGSKLFSPRRPSDPNAVGHQGECSLSFLPGTPWLACAADSSVKLVNVKTKLVMSIPMSDDNVAKSISCHPSGNKVAVATGIGSYSVLGETYDSE